MNGFLRTLLALGLLAVIGGIVALNIDRIRNFSELTVLQNEAKTAVDGGNWEKAVGIYELGWKDHPKNLDIGTRLAWLYRKNKQNEESEQLYRQILAKAPASLNARIGLAALLATDTQRLNEAVDILRPALADYPTNVTLLNQVASLYANRAEHPDEKRDSVRQWLYEQAVYYYDLSLKQNPKQFPVQFRMGMAEHVLHNWEPAAKAYCEALLLKPDNYEARYNLGMVLTAMHFPEEGYRQLDRSVAILAEQNRMKKAMSVAQQVQHVKNEYYESKGKASMRFDTPVKPPFLKAECLAAPLAEDAGKQVLKKGE